MHNCKFYVVWNEQRGQSTHKHNTLESAREEAERLCGAYPGKFHVLGHIDSCQKKDVFWDSELECDPLQPPPF